MQFTDRELQIIAAALNYMGANVDDLNEAMGFNDEDEDEPTEGKAFQESEVFDLYSKFRKQ